MMVEYFLRLALLLPLLGLMVWGSLRLTRYLQTRMPKVLGAVIGQGVGSAAGRRVELVETSLLAPGLKLAVVRFHNRELLLGCSRAGLVRLGEVELDPSGPDRGAPERVIAANPTPNRASAEV